MSPFHASLRKVKVPCILAFAALILTLAAVNPSNASARESRNAQDAAPAAPQTPPPARNDPNIFQKPVPSDQLAFLKNFDGMPSDKAIRDKQYRKLIHSMLPDCIFHYGRDMSLFDALDIVIKGSPQPVQIRDGRYMLVSGQSGPYLLGRGFIWIDMKDGIALGGFYFHPTNGEPTPTVNIFSAQVKEAALEMNQLPPAFANDLSQWTYDERIPEVTPRYFITGAKRKIVLQHDEDYCMPTDGSIPSSPEDCQQMNADAADIDIAAAYFVDATNHATNATEYMVSGDLGAWIQVRNNTCGALPDPLQCRIRMTRERVRVIIYRHP